MGPTAWAPSEAACREEAPGPAAGEPGHRRRQPRPSSGAGPGVPPFTDERGPGFARIVGSLIDIGAFEVQNPTVGPPPPGQNPATPFIAVAADAGALPQ